MPFIFLLVGLILLVVGIRGTQKELASVIVDLFTGPNNLTFWALAMIAVGSFGYVPQLRKLAIGLMVLILVSLVLSKQNQGFFQQFLDQFSQATSGAKARTSVNGLNSVANGLTLDDIKTDSQLADYLTSAGGGPFTWSNGQ
jgi:uncharacterized membrane protein YwzB